MKITSKILCLLIFFEGILAYGQTLQEEELTSLRVQFENELLVSHTNALKLQTN